jgi:hypothetical protein
MSGTLYDSAAVPTGEGRFADGVRLWVMYYP